MASDKKRIADDKKRILQLGGATKVSDALSYKKPGGPQRVQNWIKRGIPAKVKLDRPDLFPNGESKLSPSTPPSDQSVQQL